MDDNPTYAIDKTFEEINTAFDTASGVKLRLVYSDDPTPMFFAPVTTRRVQDSGFTYFMGVCGDVNPREYTGNAVVAYVSFDENQNFDNAGTVRVQ